MLMNDSMSLKIECLALLANHRWERQHVFSLAKRNYCNAVI